MKPIFACLFAALLFCNSISAQQKKTGKAPLFSYNITFSDYRLPGQIKDSSFSTALENGDWYKPGKKSFGMGISWWKALSTHIDFSGSLTGTFSNFPALFVKGDSIGQAKFTPQLDALVHLNMFTEKATVNPFLTAGVGAGLFSNQFAAYAPIGVGLKFRFNGGAFLIMQTQWRKKLTDGINDDYLHYSFGFAQSLAKNKTKTDPVISEPTIQIPADKDGDGVEDAKDECADIAGTLKGCPDSDGDGVADKNDNCPNEKGTLNGCADTDGDGIADKDDQCKDAAGLIRYNGCPIPDTDKDGLNDEEDKCPNEAGTTLTNGCPEVKPEVKQKAEYAAKSIFFKFASDVLLDASLKPLNEIATILKEYPDLKLVIDAHADNRGTPERNMYWSERRAKAVADFFTSNGIDVVRITYKGYGDTQPIGNNKTYAGRAKNRRVELKLSY